MYELSNRERSNKMSKLQIKSDNKYYKFIQFTGENGKEVAEFVQDEDYEEKLLQDPEYIPTTMNEMQCQQSIWIGYYVVRFYYSDYDLVFKEADFHRTFNVIQDEQ